MNETADWVDIDEELFKALIKLNSSKKKSNSDFLAIPIIDGNFTIVYVHGVSSQWDE